MDPKYYILIGLGLLIATVFAVLFVLLLALTIYHRLFKKPPPPPRTQAIVELRSGKLLAFDMPSEGVCYEIPNFRPGFYRIPFDAIHRAPADSVDVDPESTIMVDTGVIYFVDADWHMRLRDIYERLFQETNSCCEIEDHYEEVLQEIGIKFDFLGEDGKGDELLGDGCYVLDISRVEPCPRPGDAPAAGQVG